MDTNREASSSPLGQIDAVSLQGDADSLIDRLFEIPVAASGSARRSKLPHPEASRQMESSLAREMRQRLQDEIRRNAF